MSLTDNTTELEEVLTLANSIEVPTIKSISVNGVEQEPDENRNVDIEVPSVPITAITVNGVEQTPEEGTVNIAAVPPITEYADWVAELRTQCYTKGASTVPPAVETVQTTMANVAYAIARRGANGTLNVGAPTSSSHATTKEYVDNAISSIEIPEGGGASLYQHNIQITFTDPGGGAMGNAYITVYNTNSNPIADGLTFLNAFNSAGSTRTNDIPCIGVYLSSTDVKETIIKIAYDMTNNADGSFAIYTLENYPTDGSSSWTADIHWNFYGWIFEDRITQIL